MKFFTALFAAFIIVIIVLADMGRLPHSLRRIYDFPMGDKIGHLVLFGILNFLITLTCLPALPGRIPSRIALSIGSTLALLITLEEYSQKYSANRSSDLIDLTASLLGLGLGGWAALKRYNESRYLEIED